jgi:hypothetical protein
MGWAENALKETLVAFAKAFNLASKKVSILRLPEFTLSQGTVDFLGI